MAPLSRELSELLLRYEYLSNHLDKDGKTIDDDLEKVNFSPEGKVLREVWSGRLCQSMAFPLRHFLVIPKLFLPPSVPLILISEELQASDIAEADLAVFPSVFLR
jgi:hypothetical protein